MVAWFPSPPLNTIDPFKKVARVFGYLGIVWDFFFLRKYMGLTNVPLSVPVPPTLYRSRGVLQGYRCTIVCSEAPVLT